MTWRLTVLDPQILALKDYKDKIKPVFLYYRVLETEFILSVQSPTCCLSDLFSQIKLPGDGFANVQKGAKKKEIEGVNAPEIQKLCDNI